MHKEINNLKIKLLPTLNRGVIYTAFPIGQAIPFTILFNKQSSALQFSINTNLDTFKERVSINMYRNLDDCKFCQTFFQLQSIKDERYDYRFKFAGMNRMFERDIFRFSKEKLDLQLPDSHNKTTNNYLLVLGWKLYDIEDDLIFFFVQRRCYNNISRMNILRTMGLQFATDRGVETLDRYSEKLSNSIHKVEQCDFLKDIINFKSEDTSNG